jgi:predicted transcriptional regulator
MTWDEETTAKAVGMRRAGMTYQTIANRIGATHSAVKNKLTKMNIKSGPRRPKLNHLILNSLDRSETHA